MADAIYNAFKERLGDGGHDMDNDIFQITLHGSNFVNNSAHDYIDDIAATQTSGTGYTALGDSLDNVTWVLSGGAVEFDADDASWTTATFTADFAVIHAASGTNSGGLVCALDFGGTQSVNAGTFTVQFNSAGIIQLS
jgi:hypothetical protein